LREALADAGPRPQIRRRVRARRRADLALVDEDDLGDALGSFDARARAGDADRLAEPLLERPVEHLVDERRLAGARGARDRDEAGEGDGDVDAAKVVRGRVPYVEREPGHRTAALRGNGDAAAPGQELARRRPSRGAKAARRPREEHGAAALAGARPD